MRLSTSIRASRQCLAALAVCRAYTFGDSYLAEVDIVLPASMGVAESHDIAEALQASPHVTKLMLDGCSVLAPHYFMLTQDLSLWLWACDSLEGASLLRDG